MALSKIKSPSPHSPRYPIALELEENKSWIMPRPDIKNERDDSPSQDYMEKVQIQLESLRSVISILTIYVSP